MCRFTFAVVGYLSSLVLFSFTGTHAHAQQAAIAVGTVAAEFKPIERSGTFVGRVEAVERVDVRARVTGYLDEVLFTEGELVKEGAPLYRIEKGLFEAAITSAEAALERSKASKVLTEIQLKRAQELLDKSSGTAAARDQALAADQQADAQIRSDQANLATAKINLGYTDINSPIAGKIGKTNITKGNVVDPNSGVLTTIVSQDPMYVSFPVSQRDYLAARERNANVGKTRVRIRFSDGTTYGQVGEIHFVDVSVNRSTDTVLVRATFPNPDGVLIDGQLVQVILESGKESGLARPCRLHRCRDNRPELIMLETNHHGSLRTIFSSSSNARDCVARDCRRSHAVANGSPKGRVGLVPDRSSKNKGSNCGDRQ